MSRSGIVPRPSEAVLIRLASIAAHAEEVLAPDQPTRKARVGLQTLKNDRRRTMETVMVLLADTEVRDYLAELKRLGLVPTKA